MTFALLLALSVQDPLLDAEKERIRSRPPLSEEAKKAYVAPDPKPATPRAGYALAVLPLSFADRAPAGADLGKLFFERVSGYFAKASGGRFELRGRVYPPVASAISRGAFVEKDLEGALELFRAREGAAVYDGVAFVAAGPIGARGTALWPHQAALVLGGRSVDYVVLPEDAGDRAVGIAAHEIMHLLGLKDKYDDEKAPVGSACILGTGYNERDPAPPCADCRAALGWTAAWELDPRGATAVVMAPDVAKSVRIPVNADGTESLLLEMRDRLYAWHLGGGKRIELVGRFPSEGSDRVTPLSEPAFRGRTAGARPVWITDIRLEGGKAWFKVGPSAPLTPLEERRRSQVGKKIGD
jgi:hypothetical protein